MNTPWSACRRSKDITTITTAATGGKRRSRSPWTGPPISWPMEKLVSALQTRICPSSSSLQDARWSSDVIWCPICMEEPPCPTLGSSSRVGGPQPTFFFQWPSLVSLLPRTRSRNVAGPKRGSSTLPPPLKSSASTPVTATAAGTVLSPSLPIRAGPPHPTEGQSKVHTDR